MTPKAYMEKYKSLRFFKTQPSDGDAPQPTSMWLPDPKRPLDRPAPPLEPGGWAALKVDRYRLKPSGYAATLWQALKHSTQICIRIAEINGSISTYCVEPTDILYSVVAPFAGKGYPEECQLVLQLWDRYGIRSPSPEELINGGIGLDCNGFVGGYIDRVRSPGSWMRRTDSGKTGQLIQDLLGAARGYFGSWDDFQPPGNGCLIMGMCDERGTVKDHSGETGVGHVVITEPGTLQKEGPNGPVTVDVVESTGPNGAVGLQKTNYKIMSMTRDNMKKGIFYVQRGSKLGTSLQNAHFRIAQLSGI